MRRILLTVAYDGTGYSGFQAQKSGAKTIEGELNRALQSLTGEEILVSGASRTDAGVHALCNQAVFDTESRIPGDRFTPALNVRLPEEIRVTASREVPPDFHPRFCSTEKTYAYRIYNAQIPSPMRRLYTCFSYTPFDTERMREAAAYLVGEHDFKSFCSVHAQAKTSVRTITGISLTEEPLPGAIEDPSGIIRYRDRDGCPCREIILRVSGTGFLYNMVRIIAGTLMEVGRGAIPPEKIPEILAACDRGAAGPTAPACGLTLEVFRYLEGADFLQEIV